MVDFDDKKMDKFDRKLDKQREKNKRKTEERAAYGGTIDKKASEAVNKLYSKGILEEFVGIISAGKESNVYLAYGTHHDPVAVKIYKIDPQNTKWMKNYIIGDPRFKKIGTSTMKIIEIWCKKEHRNLIQLYRAGIPVPKPLFSIENILIMEFIGEKDGTPAPRLKDLQKIPSPQKLFNSILDLIHRMYVEAHLVHADLSEFNILIYHGKPIIIDVSQAVSTAHINALAFLERDLKNILNFFASFKLKIKRPNLTDLLKQILFTEEQKHIINK
jgi:RIO kinase 1